MSTSSRHADKFVLRMPDGMRERTNVIAAENGRSMNRELIARIERSFTEDSAADLALRALDQMTRRCEELTARLADLEAQIARAEPRTAATPLKLAVKA